MKKLFTVLAVLLVASVVFAATFAGEVAAKYTFDFDAKTVSYGKPGLGSVDAKFQWDTGDVVVGGEGDVHIDFKASASFEGWYKFNNNHADGYQPWLKYDENLANKGIPEGNWYKSPATGTAYFFMLDSDRDYNGFVALLKLSVDTFKIVGKDWSVDFLGSVALNFAKSAIDSETFNSDTAEENTQAYSIDNSVKGKHNLAVTAFGYKFGFGLFTDTTEKYKEGTDNWDDALNFALTAVTPEYDFNGVKAQAGAGYQVFNKAWQIGVSAKASYATDKWSLSGAYDLKKVEDKLINNELAVKFAIAPVDVDVYFANEGAEAKDKYYDYFDYENFDDYEYSSKKAMKADHKVSLVSNYLSAKVVVDIAKVAENVPVTVTLTGLNLVNKEKQDLSVAAETTVVPNFKFGVYFNDWFDYGSRKAGHQKLGGTVEFTGVEKLTLNGEVAYRFNREDTGFKTLFINAGAEYAHDLFTASATVAMEKDYEQDAKFGAVVGAKSTTLVAGAEISAKARFNLKNLSKLDTTATNDLTFACKVSF